MRTVTTAGQVRRLRFLKLTLTLEQTMIAYHYTTGLKFKSITASGNLIGASAEVRPPELPIVWFSQEKYWEPTASRGTLVIDGTIRGLTMRETFHLGRGLFRFGCPLTLLQQGKALRNAARIDRRFWNDLCRDGKSEGSDPALWWGSVKPVAIEGLSMEVMGDDMKWHAYQMSRV